MRKNATRGVVNKVHSFARRCVPALFVTVLIGCAAPVTKRVSVDENLVEKERVIQQEIALTQHLKRYTRLAAVADDILVNGVALCEATQPYLGFQYASVNEFPPDMKRAARNALEVGESPVVLSVVPGSPAEQAGLRAGDVLLSVKGNPVRFTGDQWSSSAAKKLRAVLATSTSRDDVSMRIRRNGATRDIVVRPVAACGYDVLLADSDAINAYADGLNIIVTSGMLRFTDSDDELALVIAHELAHNAMGHSGKKEVNAHLGLVLDVLAGIGGVNTGGTFSEMGAQAYSQEFEAEADYVGLYFMALAGRKLDEAPYFWRRMAAENPNATREHLAVTHPTSPQRFIAIQRTIDEIEAKRRKGKTLEPEIQKAVQAREDEPDSSTPPSI